MSIQVPLLKRRARAPHRGTFESRQTRLAFAPASDREVVQARADPWLQRPDWRPPRARSPWRGAGNPPDSCPNAGSPSADETANCARAARRSSRQPNQGRHPTDRRRAHTAAWQAQHCPKAMPQFRHSQDWWHNADRRGSAATGQATPLAAKGVRPSRSRLHEMRHSPALATAPMPDRNRASQRRAPPSGQHHAADPAKACRARLHPWRSLGRTADDDQRAIGTGRPLNQRPPGKPETAHSDATTGCNRPQARIPHDHVILPRRI